MKKYHNYSISEYENMYPYERDLHLEMIAAYIQEMEQKENGN